MPLYLCKGKMWACHRFPEGQKHREHTQGRAQTQTMNLMQYHLFLPHVLFSLTYVYIYVSIKRKLVYFTVFFPHTSWYLSRRTRLGGSFHSGASHRDTRSQSLEDDRSDRFCKEHSRRVHVPSQTLVGSHKTQALSNHGKQEFYFCHFYIWWKGCVTKI